MSKVNIDYSNTVIYKIICKDKSITDLYIGHTTNFIQRKYSHKQSSASKLANNKLYNVIREHGGWDNWEMLTIETFNCKNKLEALTKEQEYYEKLQATLNSVEPLPATKIVSSESVNNLTSQIENIGSFSCKRCDYSTFAKGDLKKHLNRKIPCKPVLSDIEVTILHPDFFVPDERDKSYICDFCQKGLTSRSGKSQHKKICPAKLLHDEQTNLITKQLEEQKEQLEEQKEQMTKQLEEQKEQIEEQKEHLKYQAIKIKQLEKTLEAAINIIKAHK